METIAPKKPVLRLQKNYVIEENLDAVQWPQECSVCGGPVEVKDALKLKENFKGFGEIKVEVAGIPYCQTCYPKIRAGTRLNQIVWIFAFVIGIPLGLLAIFAALADKNTNFIMCGVIFLLSIALGYGLSWLFIKLPVKTIFKSRVTEPVSAWLISEQKRDKKEGISVVISIPNKIYAKKFGILNGLTV